MSTNKVDFRATTSAVMDGFSREFTEIVVNLLEQRNVVMPTADGKEDTFVDINTGNGLLVMAHYGGGHEPYTMTTEFLVPSNDLAASFMVMWRRWCSKRGISSNSGLISLMDRVSTEKKEQIAAGNQYSSNNLAIGLMGAVLDNYPEIVKSMQWSVNSGFTPCLVIANDNNLAKCAVCYGGKYKMT